ncbi:hypothetical protein [Elizabethkingia sp. JS20170427COW]|uniref:hypothetical protein n=1 Tax=Elizabethkingia sp. JS20170427COW TaxID=2583851 RepID=UPI0011107DCA|nr:hypothetical protein [Elizabethkingia sp. JS20170427COW]QCX52538.1 hypothetical protein FGE20_01645 [Elizabethkingia sp. JS20170427COW]
MQNDFDFESLKKSWQEQTIDTHYQDRDIQKMLHSKSNSYVKYICWISLLEFCVFFFLNLYSWIKPKDDQAFFSKLQKIGIVATEQMHHAFQEIYTIFKVVSLVILLTYVIIFYLQYKKIKVEGNLKNLIISIIQFKKSVNRFILYNLLLVSLFFLLIVIFPLYYIMVENLEINMRAYRELTVGMLISCVLVLFVVYVYYKFIYGMFIRKLTQKLKQLQEI